MSDNLEQAATAFDAVLGNSGPQQSGRDVDETGAAETLFGNLGTQETDMGAGGDSDVADKPKKAKKVPEAEDDADELYNPFDADEGEEAEDDADEGEEAEDDADEGEEAEDDAELMSREFTVMVDGQEVNVDLREALNGYIRTKTFHQRMTQLDQVRGQVADYASTLVNDRQRVDEMLVEAEQLISGVIPAEPDWDRLFAEDPAAARQLQVQYNGFHNKVREIRAAREKLSREAAEKATRERAEYARNEMPKFYQVAGFRSKEEATKGIQDMRRTALNCGFSEQEVSEVYDSRMLNILLKAAKYDRLMANKPKAVKNGKTPIKPGTAPQRGPVRKGIEGARKNHARNGSIESAADVFAKMLK